VMCGGADAAAVPLELATFLCFDFAKMSPRNGEVLVHAPQ